MKINLLTYNIQHGLDYQLIKYDHIRHINLDHIADVITNTKADIIGLNEVYNSSIKNPDRVEQVKKLARYTEIKNYVFAKAFSVGGADDFGNALLSKFDVLSYEIFPVESPKIRRENAYYEDRALLKAKIGINGKTLTVFVTHFGLAKSEQELMYNKFIEEMEKCNTPFIFMGDFNQEQNSEYIQKLAEKMQMVIPEEVPTFPSINPYKRIDYIFLSNDIKLVEANVLSVVCSDHLPIFATIEI